MPDRLIYIGNMIVLVIDWMMTILTIVLVFVMSKAIYLIGTILMVAYWIGRLKREIDTHHEGSPWKYLKYWFTKKKKIKNNN